MLINLGDKVKDKVTGFTGIVIAKTEWLNGCDRVTVQPQELKDGTPIETQCFDVQQLELLEEGAIDVGRQEADRPEEKTGGPRPSPARQKDPA